MLTSTRQVATPTTSAVCASRLSGRAQNQARDVATTQSAIAAGTARSSATRQLWSGVGGTAAADHSEIHVVSDSVLHSDHSTQIVQNIATVAAADRSVSRQGKRAVRQPPLPAAAATRAAR